MTTRIPARFAACAAENRPALVTFVMAGDPDKASTHANAVLSLNPDFSIEAYLATLHYKDNADLKHHREALSRVGLPP